MNRYLFFSDKFKYLKFYFYFQFIKIGRILKILFKRSRRIKKKSFDYYQEWHFDNAFLFVDFNFENIVWFRIGEFKGYGTSNQIILDLENFNTEIIQFEVFGFFQKEVYEIILKKRSKIQSQTFKTAIFGIKNFELINPKTKRKIPKIAFQNYYPVLFEKKISLNKRKLEIDYKPFKIQDYI